jgi:arabinofuranosyltransferase
MKKWFAFAAVGLILVSSGLWFYSAIGWEPVDDAYISYVYARNAILGHGLTFNPSERVEGFTNFLWTAMMTPVVGSGADVGRVSSALGMLFGIGVLALVVLFPRRLGLPAIIGWMAALFLAFDGSFALWSISGLETSLFAFLLTLGALLYVKENFQAALPIPYSGFVFALAAMTRPEAAAVFALTAAHQGAWRLLDQRKLLTRSDLIRIGSFVALFIPYWLMRWRYYHSLLPNSFYAKVAPGGPLAQIERGVNHVEQFVGVHLGWLILLPALIALVVVTMRYMRRERIASAYPQRAANGNETAFVPYSQRYAFFGLTYFAALVIMYGAYIIYVGGDWSVGRFFVPILSFAYLLIAAGLYFIIEFILRIVARPSLVAPRAALLAVVVAFLLGGALWFASAYNGEFRIFIGGFDAARATEARITAGKWLGANVPAGTWIAVDAAGQVPYFSGLPSIDMFGINDLHIGRMPVATLGQGTPGHEKFDLGYIIARAPQYVVIYGNLFDSVSQYHRANVKWTDKPELEQFLTIYERNGQ